MCFCIIFLNICSFILLCVRLLSGRSFPGRVLLSRNTDTTIRSSRVTNPASTSDRSDGDNDPPSDFSDGGGYVKVLIFVLEYIFYCYDHELVATCKAQEMWQD